MQKLSFNIYDSRRGLGDHYKLHDLKVASINDSIPDSVVQLIWLIWYVCYNTVENDVSIPCDCHDVILARQRCL